MDGEAELRAKALSAFGGLDLPMPDLRYHALHVFDELRGYRDAARLRTATATDEYRLRVEGFQPAYRSLADAHDNLLVNADAMDREEIYIFLFQMLQQQRNYEAVQPVEDQPLISIYGRR